MTRENPEEDEGEGEGVAKTSHMVFKGKLQPLPLEVGVK